MIIRTLVTILSLPTVKMNISQLHDRQQVPPPLNRYQFRTHLPSPKTRACVTTLATVGAQPRLLRCHVLQKLILGSRLLFDGFHTRSVENIASTFCCGTVFYQRACYQLVWTGICCFDIIALVKFPRRSCTLTQACYHAFNYPSMTHMWVPSGRQLLPAKLGTT